MTLEICGTHDGHIDTFSQPGDSHKIAKKMFQLYMKIKVFSDKGLELYGNSDFEMKEYFSWFSNGIDKWCKVSVFNALTRIQKAIEIDNLKPVDIISKNSSSAVDTLTILYSVKRFWEDLKWPVADDVVNITNNVSCDICRFSVIYFDNIADRAEKCESMKHFGIFKVPLEVCVCISNINYVTQGMQQLIVELTDGSTQNTVRLQNVVANSLKHGSSRVTKLIHVSVNKMMSTIRKLLLEGADLGQKKHEIGDRLIVYIEDSLSTLQNDLYKTDFKSFKNVLWKTILDIFSEVIQKSLEVQRDPLFFSNLRTILHLLESVFANLNDEDNYKEKIKQVDYLLERYELNTSKLIHYYFKDRYQMQQQISKSPFNPFGVLSVQCFFVNNILKLEILNAKNLVPLGTRRKCDSFVKLSIVPAEMFPGIQKCRTRVEADTHFPLYDELFEL